MKWESKSLWSVYTYTIDIDKLLTPVYHLVLDVAKGTYAKRLFNEWAGEVFDIRAITGRDALDEKMTDELFLMVRSMSVKHHIGVFCRERRKQDAHLALLYTQWDYGRMSW